MPVPTHQRFKRVIQNLNYNQIRIEELNINRLVPWMRTNIPKVVEQLEPLGWDLGSEVTWLETMFINVVVNWYGNRVCLFVTDSYKDYELSKQLLSSPLMVKFWKEFDIQAHSAVLLDPFIFLEIEQLDDIYTGLNWKTRWSRLDFSGRDEDDNIVPGLQADWSFLDLEDTSSAEWSPLETAKVQRIWSRDATYI